MKSPTNTVARERGAAGEGSCNQRIKLDRSHLKCSEDMNNIDYILQNCQRRM